MGRIPAMLYDFLLLEIYYGAPDTARFYEELSQRYGGAVVAGALGAGYVACRRVLIGPDRGRLLVWLTDKGRHLAHAHAS
jgi:hypothetical protein